MIGVGVDLDDPGETIGEIINNDVVVGQRAISEKVVNTLGEGSAGAFLNRQATIQQQVSGHHDLIVQRASDGVCRTEFKG